MAKYFIAGVGHALLFKGEELFADCHTLADSSITIGVTAEDIRGGEGNKLWGQYFHDSTFSMKLTDIMFNLEYIAANCGAEIENGGEVFFNEKDVKAEGGVITLAKTAVPVVTGGTTYAWIREAASTSDEMTRVEVVGNKITGLVDGADYCIMYRYNNDAAQQVTIKAQFIPDTLHAVLTVALYSGDNCNVEASTKAGEITIDIPRFQLTGAMELSMSATGTCQTPLEGNALASGCSGCDNDGIYATITKVILNSVWYDNATAIVAEPGAVTATAGEEKEQQINVYAIYPSGAPKRIEASKLNFALPEGTTGVTVDDAGKVTIALGATAGTYVVTITAKKEGEEGIVEGLTDSVVITVVATE